LGALSTLGILTALAVSGCGSTAGSEITGNYPDITLTESKSPVQFLRNDAAGRIPPAVIDTVVDTVDASSACLDEEKDPEGLIRSWHSSTVVTIARGSAWRVDSVIEKLIASFTDADWTAHSLGQSATLNRSLLKSSSSLAEIQIIGQRPAETEEEAVDDETPVTIEIEVHGPCVRTAGATSTEVLKLEGADKSD
jgi:hypothetical protein